MLTHVKGVVLFYLQSLWKQRRPWLPVTAVTEAGRQVGTADFSSAPQRSEYFKSYFHTGTVKLNVSRGNSAELHARTQMSNTVELDIKQSSTRLLTSMQVCATPHWAHVGIKQVTVWKNHSKQVGVMHPPAPSTQRSIAWIKRSISSIENAVHVGHLILQYMITKDNFGQMSWNDSSDTVWSSSAKAIIFFSQCYGICIFYSIVQYVEFACSSLK